MQAASAAANLSNYLLTVYRYMELTSEFTLIWSKFLGKCTVALYDMKELNVVLNFLVLLTRTLWEIYCSISRTILVNLRKIFRGGFGWSSRTLRVSNNWSPNKYMLFAGWEVRMVKNCDRGREKLWSRSWKTVIEVLKMLPETYGKTSITVFHHTVRPLAGK